MTDVPFDPALHTGPLTAWLADALGATVTALTAARLAGGHSGGAWRLDAVVDGRPGSFVLKAPGAQTLVYQRDVGREARILAASFRGGAPVPEVVAIDDAGTVVGTPCFVMRLVDGRGPGDEPPAGCHGDGWLRDAGPVVQRRVWDSFHEALAAVHAVPVATVPDASLGPDGLADYFAYWRASLLDIAAPDDVPRHLAALDWLAANLPEGAEEDPALCMADARLGNAIVAGDEVCGLVDFEVAYLGNPAADVGYSLFFDALQRRNTADPLPGFAGADATWAHWERASGRVVSDPRERDYWIAFAAAVLCVTAARAMVQWGMPSGTIEAGPGMIDAWEAAVGLARG